MLSDTSSTADDETARLNDLYANVGKHRIKIKGDEIKIKGRSKIIEILIAFKHLQNNELI